MYAYAGKYVLFGASIGRAVLRDSVISWISLLISMVEVCLTKEKGNNIKLDDRLHAHMRVSLNANVYVYINKCTFFSLYDYKKCI